MMFGYGPPKPTDGDPTQLAFLQMWSFSYFAQFKATNLASEAPPLPKTFAAPSIPGFAAGNPFGYQNFVWNSNFGMTAFMTPVNEQFNPLPTRVLYVWKPDARYATYADRSQNTLMLFTYNQPNPSGMVSQEALLTGPAPVGMAPPPNSDTGFSINFLPDGSCRSRTSQLSPAAPGGGLGAERAPPLTRKPAARLTLTGP